MGLYCWKGTSTYFENPTVEQLDVCVKQAERYRQIYLIWLVGRRVTSRYANGIPERPTRIGFR